MQLSLSYSEFLNYCQRMANYYLPDYCSIGKIESSFKRTLERLEYNFQHIQKPYYCNQDGMSTFSHRHTDHMAIFLYLLSNQCFKDQNIVAAEKFFYLNKILHGFDAFYAIQLPDIFMLVHPVGSVLGNAHYQNYLAIYQQVTIGSDPDGIFPSFEEGCILYSGASVISHCHIGRNCILGANTFIRKTTIPDNTVVYGQHPNSILKKNTQNNLLWFVNNDTEHRT